MNQRPYIILNPAARGEKARPMLDIIESLEPKPVVRLTTAPGDAEAMAERAVEQGFDTIIAAGGDGTVNEVINGLAGSSAKFGLLPVGTMNVFATELGLPNSVAGSWEVIKAGHVRQVDLAKANDQYFVQLAGIGLDAQIVMETEREFRKNFGPLSYLVTASQVVTREAPKLMVELPDGRELEGSFVLIGNGRYYGGKFVVFKEAKIDDGLLDVIIFGGVGHLDLVRYLQAFIFGDPATVPDVQVLQTPSLRVTSEEKVPVEVDGEVMGFVPVDICFSPTKLNVLAAPGAPIEGS